MVQQNDPLLWFCGVYDPKRSDYNCSYGTQVPVRALSCSASIRDLVADVEMRLTFENTTTSPVEAVFYFRHYEVALYHFDVKIRDKTVVGKVHEKEKAANIYDDAIASGHGSYLVEKSDTSDTFKMSLGNLPPKESCTITIRYITKLTLMNDIYIFSFPIPSAINSNTSNERGITVNISAEMNSPISAINSDTHPKIQTTIENTSAKINYETNSVTSNAGFAVKLKLEDPFVPTGYVLPSSNRIVKKPSDIKPEKDAEQFAEGHIVALNLCPKLVMSEDDIDRVNPSDLEILFLLDQSGSMSGSRIEQAKNALQIYLRSLPEGCYFNIFGFGSNYQCWQPESVVYNQQTLDKASNHIQSLSANLGGTEILQPLSFMLSGAPKRIRNIILLTDGEVNNASDILNMVKSRSKDSRVFTLGIGEASRFLVEGIAKYGRGHAEFVNSGERVEAKVLRTLQYVIAPTLRHVKVDWSSLPLVRQAPQEISSVFVGEHAVIYGFLDKSFDVNSLAEKPVEVTVSGKIGKKNFESKVSLGQFVNEANARLTEVSAVHKLIRDLENDSVNSKTSTYLSVAYNLVSKTTSMVAVEERDESILDAPVQIYYVNGKESDIPVSTPNQVSVSPVSPRRNQSRSSDKISQVQRDVDAVKAVMAMNIDRVLERSERLESLMDRSDDLQANSVQFVKGARRLSSGPSSWFSGIGNVLESIGSSISSAFTSTSSAPNNNNNQIAQHSEPQEDVPAKASVAYSKVSEEEKEQPTSEKKSSARKVLPTGSHIRFVDKIIYLQSFDGSWELEPTLLDLLKVSFSTLESNFDSQLMAQEEFKTLLATLLAVTYITTKFPDLQAEWQMVVTKASRFIKKSCDNLKQDETLLKAALSQLV